VQAVTNIAAFREMYRIPVGCPKKAFPIGVSIMGHPLEHGDAKLAGVVECVQKALPVADFLEINESCPNVKHHKGSTSSIYNCYM
jgi:dihydroorotate dehydrogenase